MSTCICLLDMRLEYPWQKVIHHISHNLFKVNYNYDSLYATVGFLKNSNITVRRSVG